MFFDVVGAASTLVPGGGIDLSEYGTNDLRAHQQAFLARHRGTKPFVLVLGRKAAGKNYQMAIDAILAINGDGHCADLVLIGPDDDGDAGDCLRTLTIMARSRAMSFWVRCRSHCVSST